MPFPNLDAYRGLIFDLDGTLINSMPFHAEAWIQAAREHGFEIDTRVIYQMGGVSSRDVVVHFKNQGLPVGDIDEFVKRKVELYRERLSEVETFPRVLDILLEAYGRGVKIAVGSGTQLINARDILRRHHLEDKVAAVVTSEQVSRHKPHPDTFLLCAEKLGLKPADCLVFEDGPLGLEAAGRAGMDCVEVKDGEFVRLLRAGG